ncbi:hypothetical protein A7982_12257 [Minicystis rosea]|nr:hypothetical protein A7982_12257 [Minicystis rosea]
MGLKRRNPARSRLLTAPEMLTIMATSPKPAANVQAPAPAKPATTETVEVANVDVVKTEIAKTEIAGVAKVEVARHEIEAPPAITSDERHRMIAKAAYRHAERAGFTSDPLQNWLLAEREVDAQLARLAS